MIIQRLAIQDRYPIQCKVFLPTDQSIQKVIIGVHGFAGDKESSMLRKLAKSATENHTALVCFDFPAHGSSSQTEEMLTVENCTADLIFVTNWVKHTYHPEEISIFATSFGGYIALLAAEKLPCHRMILRAPAVSMPQVLLNAILKLSSEEFQKLEIVECGFERKINLPYSFYEDLTRNDPYRLSYNNSILVIHGAKDDVVPLQDVVEFCNNRGNIHMKVLENADHRFKNHGEVDRVVQEAIQFITN